MSWRFPRFTPGAPVPWDQLQKRFDWLSDMQGVVQNPLWHAEGDVLVHTQMVVQALLEAPGFVDLPTETQHVLFATALLHDCEKRSCTRREIIDGQEIITSTGHARRGAHTTRGVLYRDISTPFALREQMVQLVRLHSLPIWAIEKPDPNLAVIRASVQVRTDWLSRFARADVEGRVCDDQNEMRTRVQLFEELCQENQCFGPARVFPSALGRFQYFQRGNNGPDYIPFDDRKFDVVMLSGLPGSGKDTYLRRQLDLPVLSLDDLRRQHKIAPTDKKGNGQIIQMAREKARVFMRKKQSFVFNATNITRSMRELWISLFTAYGGRVKIVYLEVPYRTLLRQNQNRAYPIPVKVLENMIDKLDVPTLDEAQAVEWIV
ncbi:MAG: ATP-binding protein [Bacteroidota bacterium]